MRTVPLLSLAKVATAVVLVALIGLESSRDSAGSKTAASEPGHSESFTFTYPYRDDDSATDAALTDNGYAIEMTLGGISDSFPLYEAPDQKMLDQASTFGCPKDAERREVPSLGFSLCVPPGWKVEVQQPEDPETAGPEEPVVILSSEPELMAKPLDPSTGIVTVSLILTRRSTFLSMAECPEPGALKTKDGPITVCFLKVHTLEGSDVVAHFRSMAFSGGSEPGWKGILTSIRVLGTSPPDLSDPAFREALTILGNIHFE